MKRICILLIVISLLFISFAGCNSDKALKKELEALNRRAEQLDRDLDTQQSKLDRLTELKNQYDALQDKIARLQPGTTEYIKAVDENNRLVRQMVREFPELEPYVKEE